MAEGRREVGTRRTLPRILQLRRPMLRKQVPAPESPPAPRSLSSLLVLRHLRWQGSLQPVPFCPSKEARGTDGFVRLAWPWPVWLSGLSISLQTKTSLV